MHTRIDHEPGTQTKVRKEPLNSSFRPATNEVITDTHGLTCETLTWRAMV